MRCRFVRVVVLLTLLLSSVAGRPTIAADSDPADSPLHFDGTDWPWWRGPNRNGVADPNQQPPLKWSDKENVVWKQKIPGRGHGSAIVVGEQVLVTTADLKRQAQSVLCFNRGTGKLLWETDVHQGGVESKGNEKSTLASSSPACDGERIFVTFLNGGSVYASALDRSGNKRWQQKITEFVVHQGYGASPAIYGPLVIVSADNKGTGAIAGLDRVTGEIVWRQERPSVPNYTSPIILNVAGREQLLMTGCDFVSSFDPLSGEKLWEVKGATTECVTSTVTDGERIFTSGGYPRNHLSAVRADGSGKVDWENENRVYVPSLLIKDGYLYGTLDAGVAACWKSDTGKEMWKKRLGGTFSSSPVLVGENIYATNESGKTFIFKADPDRFSLVAENQLGDEVFATPAICGSQIFTRVAVQIEGERQEFLYCVGTK